MEWKVLVGIAEDKLEAALNDLARKGWEVHSIIAKQPYLGVMLAFTVIAKKQTETA